jgi:hypothetical protein
LDEILSADTDPTHDALNGLAVLACVDRLLPAGIRARLAIPFGFVAQLDTALPLLDAPSVSEPPSIYLFQDEYFSEPSDREEYRRPFSATPWGNGYAAEYVCGRSLRERELNWEFTRTVWVRVLSE